MWNTVLPVKIMAQRLFNPSVTFIQSAEHRNKPNLAACMFVLPEIYEDKCHHYQLSPGSLHTLTQFLGSEFLFPFICNPQMLCRLKLI